MNINVTHDVLTSEQLARAAALQVARNVLETREPSRGFGQASGLKPPPLGDLIKAANYVVRGNPDYVTQTASTDA